MILKNIVFAIAALFVFLMTSGQDKLLSERLGYKPTDKLLIVNCDDVGMCHSANLAAIEGLEKGQISSGTIMVPCPWFPEIADYAANKNRNLDLGVHLTHTAEWKYYRWQPLAEPGLVKGLSDEMGFMWRDVREVYQHATPEQALIEGRAQIQKALDAGIPITHIDSHMGTLQYNPDYMQVYLQLAVEFNLPARMPSQSTLESMGAPDLRKIFTSKGIVFPDYFVFDEMKSYDKKDVPGFWESVVKELKPGVTEVFIHATIPGDEIKSITNSWRTRNQEYELFVNDDEFKALLEKEGIKLIGYRPLLELQQSIN
jgi:hypothetical protein